MIEKNQATADAVAGNRKRFCKLRFRRKITIFDFDQAAQEKAVQVLRIHRVKETVMHIFYRQTRLLFHDPNSGWSYNILIGELD